MHLLQSLTRTPAKSPKVDISNFTVVNFMSSELTPEVEAWREGAKVCSAQSCARQTWFGDYNDMGSFPIGSIKSNKIDFLIGKEAYLFMLRLMLGLETKKNVAETNICGQMNRGWDVFKERMPEEAAKLRSIYDALTADSRLIRGRILDNEYIAPTLANAANRLAQKKGGEIVTIIAHGERNGGSLSQETIDLIKRFAAVKKNFASALYVMAADGTLKKMVEKEVRDMSAKGHLHVGVDVKDATLPNLSTAFNKSNLVFCAKPMAPSDGKQDFDEDLILAWDQRAAAAPHGKFIHLKGVPQDKGASSKLWRDFGLTDYSSPENVANEQAHIRLNNERVLGIAVANTSHFARLRFEGTQPGKKHLILE
jgi:hypothetical protein